MSKQIQEEKKTQYESPLAHLLQIGRDKGFVTLDDISEVFPKRKKMSMN